MTSGDAALRFEPLTEARLPLLAAWRASAHVARWFHGPLTAAQTAAKFLPRIRGEDPVSGFIVHADGAPVGYVQSYRVADQPDAAATIGVASNAHGIDVLVGDADALGRGLGTRIAREFSDRVLRTPGVEHVVTNPDCGNAAAIRMYEKAGFARIRAIPGSRDEHPHLLMERRV